MPLTMHQRRHSVRPRLDLSRALIRYPLNEAAKSCEYMHLLSTPPPSSNYRQLTHLLHCTEYFPFPSLKRLYKTYTTRENNTHNADVSRPFSAILFIPLGQTVTHPSSRSRPDQTPMRTHHPTPHPFRGAASRPRYGVHRRVHSAVHNMAPRPHLVDSCARSTRPETIIHMPQMFRRRSPLSYSLCDVHRTPPTPRRLFSNPLRHRSSISLFAQGLCLDLARDTLGYIRPAVPTIIDYKGRRHLKWSACSVLAPPPAASPTPP